MNYQRHYDDLISRARTRELSGYSERHHIQPKCLGGANDENNIVRLTAEEHFLAHQLLVRMFPGNRGLIWAAVAMTNGTGKHLRGNKLYGWLRRMFAERVAAATKGRKHTDEARAKMSAAHLGVKLGPKSAETRAKMSAASRGKSKSPEHIAKMAVSKRGKKIGPISDETRSKMSASIKAALSNKEFANRRTPEYRRRQAEKMREIWSQRRSKSIGD